MPYTTPTVDQFRTRFPIFDDREDELITMLLDEASGHVGLDWRESDYQPAILYLAAHLLATDNSAEGEDVEFGGAGGDQVASESFGGMSISYKTNSGGGSLSSNERFGSTEYGRRYLTLLRNNVPGIMAI
jgi:hypothetical protein